MAMLQALKSPTFLLPGMFGFMTIFFQRGFIDFVKVIHASYLKNTEKYKVKSPNFITQKSHY